MRQLQVMNTIRDARAPFLRGGSPKAILFALATFSNGDGWSWPSLETLGAAAGLSERATWPVVAKLEASGVLEVVRGRQQQPNRYRIRAEALSVLKGDRRTDARSVLGTEVPSVLRQPQNGSLRTPERKITSSRTEATSDEGSQEGAQVKEPSSVAAATDGFQLEIVDPKPTAPTDHQRVIGAYVDAYAGTHNGERPDIGAADGKWVKSSLKRRGLEKTIEVIATWFADPWRAERQPTLHKIDANAASAPRLRPGVQPVPVGGSTWRVGLDEGDAT